MVQIDVGVNWFNNPKFTSSASYTSGPSNATAHPEARVGLVWGVLAAAGKASIATANGASADGLKVSSVSRLLMPTRSSDRSLARSISDVDSCISPARGASSTMRPRPRSLFRASSPTRP